MKFLPVVAEEIPIQHI